MENFNILVVEDEVNILNVVVAYLEKEGFKTHKATNGQEALEIFQKEPIDFIVLDLMIPLISGEELCRTIRNKSQVPILILTAKADEDNILKCLGLGADDYMTKPFSPRELVARIRAIKRRVEGRRPPSFTKGDLKIHFQEMKVVKSGQVLDLSSREFQVLKTLVEHRGQVLTREQIIENAFGQDYEAYSRTIDTYIKNLRQKLGGQDSQYIETIYGAGYRFID